MLNRWVLPALAAAIVTLPLAAADAVPTFTKDVAPILYQNCATCHRPNDIAPMALLTYEQVRPWAASIREKVSSGEMPPWHSTDAHGTFSNDRRLSAADKDTILRWASNGAPQGNPKDLPPPPKFADGWEIGTPDLVLTMPKAFNVVDKGTINYQYFQIPTNFTEDKWIQAIEVRPGVRKVVHHILVFNREPGNPAPKSAFMPVAIAALELEL
jgi:mono/diheme cytochrome c family protein